MRRTLILGSLVLAPVFSMAATQPELDTARDKAVAWLAAAQAADGRWTSAPGLDVQTTAAAVEALTAAGMTRMPSFAQGVAWLQNAEAGSADALARQVIALHKAGATVASSRLVTRLLAQRNGDDKSWGAYAGYRGSIPDTPLALLALKAAGTAVSDTATLATAFDSALYGTAGQRYWLHRLGTENTKAEGLGERIVPTALAIQALKSFELSSASRAEAVAYLVSRQAASGTNQGGFAGNDGAYAAVDAAVAGEAIAAHSASGRSDASAQSALDFLKRTQLANGSWGDTLSTAVALKFVATASSAIVDTDNDGVSNAVEQLVGTNPNLADSKELALNQQQPASPAPNDDEHYAYWALRGRSLSYKLTLAGSQTCCTLQSGALPPGVGIAASGSPVTLSLTGTPSANGMYEARYSYRTTSGIDKLFRLRVEIEPTLFKVEQDPYVLAPLFASDANLNKLKGAWQIAVDDFNRDGRVDQLSYFSAANEWFRRLNCGTCAAYAGPDWGQLVGFQGFNGSLARATPLLTEPKFAGDVRNMFVVDFNNDGKKDLILNLNRVTTASVDPADKTALPFRAVVALRNDSPDSGLLAFTDVTTALKLETAPEGEVVVLDVNRDAYPDYVVSAGASSAKLYVYNTTLGFYEDKSATSGLGMAIKPTAVDFDGDRLVDLVTRDNTTGIRFYRNKGDGTFAAVSNETSLPALPSRRVNRIVPADLNNDGLPELVLFETASIGTGAAEAYAGSRVTVLKHGGMNASAQPRYTETAASVLTDTSNLPDAVNLGGAVADIDSDGLKDIIVAARDVSSTQVENIVFKQQSDGSFVKLTTETGWPAGVTAFDAPVPVEMTGDGKLDMLWPNSLNASYLLTSESNENHAIQVELIGKTANKLGLGAKVQVNAWGKTQYQQSLSLHGLPKALHFGLGAADSAVVTVTWPDGAVQTVNVTSVDRTVTIIQP